MGQPTRHTLFAPTLYMFLFLGATYEKKSTTKKRPLFHRLRRRAPCMQKHYSSIYTLISSSLFEQCLSAESKTTPIFFIYKKTTTDDKKEYRCLVTTARETTYQHFAYCLAFVYGATALLFNLFSLLFFFLSCFNLDHGAVFVAVCGNLSGGYPSMMHLSALLLHAWLFRFPSTQGGWWQSCGW